MCGQFVMVPKEVVEEIIQDILRKRIARALPDYPAQRPVQQPVEPPAQLTIPLSAHSAAQPAALQPADARLQPTQLSAYPKSTVALIVPQENTLAAAEMQWGYEVPWSKNVVFNTRFDTATKPEHSMWTESLEKRRCIVPTAGFFEPHQSETYRNPRTGRENKQKYFFSRPGVPITFLAGIYQDEQFSIMTTDPNNLMRPIHNRMPVVLEPEELNTWLYGDYALLANRSAVKLVAEKA